MNERFNLELKQETLAPKNSAATKGTQQSRELQLHIAIMSSFVTPKVLIFTAVLIHLSRRHWKVSSVRFSESTFAQVKYVNQQKQ